MSAADVEVWMERIDEAVRYRAPAFFHGGIMAYFHWNAKGFASLIFPRGSEVRGSSNDSKVMVFSG